jgi:hypothetical protein
MIFNEDTVQKPTRLDDQSSNLLGPESLHGSFLATQLAPTTE